MFVGLHALLANNLDTPELAISPDEGKQFMTAVQNVMRHYSVETTQKSLDWIALAGCAAGMYFPRVAAVSIRRKGRQRQAVAAKPPVPPSGAPAPAGAALHIVPDMHGGNGFQEVGE